VSEASFKLGILRLWSRNCSHRKQACIRWVNLGSEYAGWRPAAVRTETALADRYAGPPPGFSLAESCSAVKPCVTLSHFSCSRKMITGFSCGWEWFTAYWFTDISTFVCSSSAREIPWANLRESQHYGHRQFKTTWLWCRVHTCR
jgi:hypothetical protein